MKSKSILRGLLIIIILSMIGPRLKAQDEKRFGLEAYGWVSGMYFYDTRQTSSAREGLLSYYPLNQRLDANGKDINARPNSNLNFATSRVGMRFYTPDLFGAKTAGNIEADFSGQSDPNIYVFRLRQAHITLDWERTRLLIGHTWTPFFILEMMPSVQDLHNGGPFHPFSRNNQIRLEQMLSNSIKMQLAAGFQRDYASIGINGRDPFNQISSNIPEMSMFFHYKSSNWFAGLGGEYKALKPRHSYSHLGETLVQNALVHSYITTAFLNYKNESIDIKFQGIYGQNMNNHMMLGGFVESIFDPVSKTFSYSPTNTASAWLDVLYPLNNYRFGLFMGYTQNLGHSAGFDVGQYYGTDKDIANVYRVAPRMEIHPSPSYFITLQAEYTQANYGDWQSKTGEVIDIKGIENYRLSFAFTYKFNTPRLRY